MSFAFRWSALKDGSHSVLKKPENEQLKDRCIAVGKECDNRKIQKFNIGSNPASAIKDAQSGLWAAKKTPNKKQISSSPVSQMLALQSKKHDEVKSYKQKVLEEQTKQTKAMERIGDGINLLSKTDGEYYFEFKDFVLTKFKPEHRADDIIDYSRNYKDDCVAMFRAFERNKENYHEERKIRLIQHEFDKWLRAEQALM